MPPSKVVLTNGTVGSPKLTVDFIDVGQGNAVLVSYPAGGFMLVDCGSQERSLSGRPFRHAESYINTVTGGTDIGTVVMTHGDIDHTVFVPSITRAQNPTDVHYGGTIGDFTSNLQTWIHSMEGTKGRSVWRYNPGYSNVQPDADYGSPTGKTDARTSVLCASYGDDSNSRSIVLMIRFGSQAVILPGDAEWDTEAYIMSKVPENVLEKCTVLMAGHHGAHESTSKAWAKALDPDIDAMSASGTNMSYAHPACSTNALLAKYSKTGATEHDIICADGKGEMYERTATNDAIFVTATNGDIRYQTDGTNYKVMVSSLTAAVPQVRVLGPSWSELVANSPWQDDRHPGFVNPAFAAPLPIPRAAGIPRRPRSRPSRARASRAGA